METAYFNGMVTRETYGVIADNIHLTLEIYPGSLKVWRDAIDGLPALSGTGVFQTVDRLLKERGQ